ncbi:MAG: hypothetical protein OZSIB_4035 [Candidatus Ozemobacter sibiricus]|jgi:hypothetical protein|uniref:Cytidyltransferase-like domain-containing protein n=1 Tax=Candidatus Ozemobacter sibiricus TaxID=2268124 RepID=A0A367ZRB4_9BACT|nr:MAG: hypothetical protein OZSIB_4035 [Candidatus Ozemobacter sibiricus]
MRRFARAALLLWLWVAAWPWAAWSQDIRRLGIFAGTFDPFHHQHLQVAREAADRLHLDRVLIVPNGSKCAQARRTDVGLSGRSGSHSSRIRSGRPFRSPLGADRGFPLRSP